MPAKNDLWKYLVSKDQRSDPEPLDPVFGCKQFTVLQTNEIKSVWSILGEETDINSNTDLIPERVGTPAKGCTQKRSWASGNEEICESAQWKNKKTNLHSSYMCGKVPDGLVHQIFMGLDYIFR